MREGRLVSGSQKKFQPDPWLVLFSAAYILGVVGGIFSGKASGVNTEISSYLQKYAQALASGSSITAASILGVVAAYYRMPCAAFLLGWVRHSVYFFCGLFMAEGFFLSYAVTCFSIALGRDGVLISVCVLGVRALFVLPCALYLAVLSKGRSAGRSSRTTVRGRRAVQERTFRFLFLIPAILVLGVLCELTFVPRLAAFALQYIS